jgi:hypothetical protein
MEPVDRPNIDMEALVNEAIAMAEVGTRSAAAEFLYRRKCSLDVIARVLAKSPDPTKIRHSTGAHRTEENLRSVSTNCQSPSE